MCRDFFLLLRNWWIALCTFSSRLIGNLHTLLSMRTVSTRIGKQYSSTVQYGYVHVSRRAAAMQARFTSQQFLDCAGGVQEGRLDMRLTLLEFSAWNLDVTGRALLS